MKKLIISLVAMIGLTFATNAQQAISDFSEEEMLLCISDIHYDAESSTLDFLVKTSQAVEDFCNYFNGSWADVGLNLYCRFSGDIVTCTIYKATKAACTLNGAVRLYLEGDINSAVRRLILGTADVYTLSRSGKNYSLEPARNFTPVNWQ